MLIAMAAHSTIENQRIPLTLRALSHLIPQLRAGQDTLYVIMNGCDDEGTAAITGAVWTGTSPSGKLIVSRKNIGTAAAINMAWAHRIPGQVLCKLDDDTLVYDDDWIRKMEEAILISMERGTVPEKGADKTKKDMRGPKTQIGILGLKRRDLWERPDHENEAYRSTLAYLPHQPGEHWIAVEFVRENVMGTVTAFNPNLIDRIGGLYQMQDHGNLYGFDDSLASQRAYLAGFARGFLIGVDIEHIDPGNTDYYKRKGESTGRFLNLHAKVAQEYMDGKRDIYYPLG